MPSQTCAHRMCDSGTSDWFITSANGGAKDLLGREARTHDEPGEQVPRMPSVSHAPVCSSSYWPERVSTRT